MNRKKDLENLSKLYEGYTGIEPDNIGLTINSRPQRQAVNALLRRGYEVHREYSEKNPDEIVLVKGENAIDKMSDTYEIYGVNDKGEINGQPLKSFLADKEEDENDSYEPGIVQKNQASEDEDPLENLKDKYEFNFDYDKNIEQIDEIAPLLAVGGALGRGALAAGKLGAQAAGALGRGALAAGKLGAKAAQKGAQMAGNVAQKGVQMAGNVAQKGAQMAQNVAQKGTQMAQNVAQKAGQAVNTAATKAGQAAQRGIESGATQATKAMMQNPQLLMQLGAQQQQQQQQQPVQQQPVMQQQPVQQQPMQSNEEEFKKGDEVMFLNQPDLSRIKDGSTEFPFPKFKNGTIIHAQDGVAFVDTGIGIQVLPIEDLKKEEEAEDLGPNQEPESWGDEAMGDEQPGETSARFSQDTPDDPASGGGRNIDNPDEEENDDPYYNREEDLRSRGIDPDAEDPDADEKGKEERNHEDEEMSLQKALEVINQHMHSKNKYGDDYDIEDESLNFGDREKAMKVYIKNFNKKIKKESFNSHGDRDMSLLAENYLNIKRHE